MSYGKPPIPKKNKKRSVIVYFSCPGDYSVLAWAPVSPVLGIDEQFSCCRQSDTKAEAYVIGDKTEEPEEVPKDDNKDEIIEKIEEYIQDIESAEGSTLYEKIGNVINSPEIPLRQTIVDIFKTLPNTEEEFDENAETYVKFKKELVDSYSKNGNFNLECITKCNDTLTKCEFIKCEPTQNTEGGGSRGSARVFSASLMLLAVAGGAIAGAWT